MAEVFTACATHDQPASLVVLEGCDGHREWADARYEDRRCLACGCGYELLDRHSALRKPDRRAHRLPSDEGGNRCIQSLCATIEGAVRGLILVADRGDGGQELD